MSKYSGASSYNHRVKAYRDGSFEIFWTVDFHYPSSRLRHPRGFSKWTDEAGAKRFCKKWGLEMPVAEAA